MYEDIEQWARLVDEASTTERAIMVLGISECLGTKEMTNGEMARAKANGFVSKSGFKKITKAIEAYYVAEEKVIQSLTERTMFWSNCEGPAILEKINALGLKPSLVIANNSRTDFGLRPSNEMPDNLIKIRKQYNKTLPIYYFTASYSDGMRYSTTIRKEVLTGHIFTPDEHFLTRTENGVTKQYIYADTDREREVQPDEIEQFTLYTISGMWKKIEFSQYKAIEFDEEVINTAEQVGRKDGASRLRGKLSEYREADKAQYVAFFKQKSKGLNECDASEDDTLDGRNHNAHVEENEYYDVMHGRSIKTVADLIKVIKKFKLLDEIHFIDPDGVPVNWEIKAIWDAEYDNEEFNAGHGPEDLDQIFIRVGEAE